MKNTYDQAERIFEKLTFRATKVLGNSITFLFALALVLFWWINDFFSDNTRHDNIGDFIFGTTFLSLFIIQKSFNRFSALINLKINELITSHEPANNEVLNDVEKTEKEITEMANEYVQVPTDEQEENKEIEEEIKQEHLLEHELEDELED